MLLDRRSNVTVFPHDRIKTSIAVFKVSAVQGGLVVSVISHDSCGVSGGVTVAIKVVPSVSPYATRLLSSMPPILTTST